MKRFELTVARIEESESIPLIVVQAPWKYFSHPLGVPTFASVLTKCMPDSKIKYWPIVVSLSSQGEWHCDPQAQHHWKRITATTKAAELEWHTMRVEAAESPFEEMERSLKIFPYGKG